jgi:hypothetical protein
MYMSNSTGRQVRFIECSDANMILTQAGKGRQGA